MPAVNTRLRSRGGAGSSGGGWSLGGGSRSSAVPFQGEDATASPLDLKVLRSDDLPALETDLKVEATRKILTLLKSPNKEAQAKGIELARDGLDPKTLKSLGLDQQAEKESGPLAFAKGVAASAGGGLLGALGLINRPQQATTELLQGAAYDTGLNKLYEPEGTTKLSVPDNATPEVRKIIGDAAGSGGYRDAWRALKGEERWDPASQRFTKDLHFSNALGKDSADFNGGGVLNTIGKVADFTGGAAIDPLNLVGGGSSGAAKKVAGTSAAVLAAEGGAKEFTPALLKQIERQGGGVSEEAITQAIGRIGPRAALSESQLAKVTAVLRDEAESAVGRTTTGRITGKVRTAELRDDRLVRKGARALTGKGSRTGAERVAEDAVLDALRYDRGGFRVGGRSLTPEGVRSPVRAALKGDRIQIGSRAAEAAVLEDAAKLAQRQENTASKLSTLAATKLQESEGIPKALPAAEDGARWHGSSSVINDVSANAYGGASASNLYGPGFYTTDDVAIAGSYTKKGRGAAPTIHKVEWLGDEPARFLNIDTTPITPEIADSISREMSHLDDLPVDAEAEVLDSIRAGEPISSVYDKFRSAAAQSGLTKTEANEIFDTVNDNIESMGYDGISHRGGVKTGGTEHNVEIYLPNVVASGRVRAIPQEATTAPEALKMASSAKSLDIRARNALAKADEIRNTTDARALLEIDPSLGRVTAPVVEEIPRKIFPNVTPVADGVGKLREAFQTRAGIRASKSLTPGIDQQVYDASIKAGGLTNQAAREGERLLNQAYKNSDVVTPELVDDTRRALDIGGSTDDLIDRVAPEQRPYVQAMIDLRDKTHSTIVDNALADELKLRGKDDYLARYITPEGRPLLEKANELNPNDVDFKAYTSSAKQQAGQGGHLKARKIFADEPIENVERYYKDKLATMGIDVPEGVNILEHDPGKILSRRYNDMLPALQFKNTVKGMEKNLKDTIGQDLVKVVDPGQDATKEVTKRGLQKVDLGEAGAVYAHPDLVPEITNFKRLTIEPDAVGAFGRTMDGWNRLWKSYATVPVITGSGFHVKNTIGNMFNNYLAGVGTYAYKDAIELQKDIWQAKRAFPELSVPEAMAKNGASADKVAKAELAFENQILEEGFFNTDLKGKAEHAIHGNKTGKQRVLAKVDVRNPETMFGVPTGRKIGEHVEDNARLAHFISKLDETGDAAQAAASVRKYLFDYGDLTPFERKVGKRVHAFYTFTRKNTPLQFSEIARNPAAFNRLGIAERTLLGQDEGGGTDIPSFMDEIGQPVGRSQAGLLSGNKNQVVANIDTPFDAAAKTVDPLLFLAGEKSAADAAQGVLGNVSGGPAQLVRGLAEEATGKSLFTGSDLKDPEGRRKVAPALRVADLFIPSISKAARTAGLSAAGAQTDGDRLRIIRALTGLQAKEVTPEMKKIAQNERLRDIKDIIEALKKDNVDVPTISELQALGVLKRTERRKAG